MSDAVWVDDDGEEILRIPEHLPECPFAHPRMAEFQVPLCICDRLRAAQERGTARAYDRGLTDAREAVAACPRAGVSVYRGGLIEADTAIAAIDALKGES